MSDEREPDTSATTREPPEGSATGDSLTEGAAERAERRRSRSKMLRIPDDEVARPVPTPYAGQVARAPLAASSVAAAPIMPTRIIDVGGPPRDRTSPPAATVPTPVVTNTAPSADDSWTPYQPTVAARGAASPGAYSSVDASVDMPVDMSIDVSVEMSVDDLASTTEVPMAALSSSLLFDADASLANIPALTNSAAQNVPLSSRPPPPRAEVLVTIPAQAAVPRDLDADRTLISEATALGEDAAEAALRALDERDLARETAKTAEAAELEADDVMAEEPVAHSRPVPVSSVPPRRLSGAPSSRADGRAPPLPPTIQRTVIAPAGSTPTPASVADSSQRRKARLWWEEMFGEDYLRATGKITDAQIATEVDFIEDSLGVAKGGTMLDLACGTGLHTVEFARRGYQAVGFDLSLTMLARAAEEAQERGQKVNFVQGDMREMPFENAFDGIYCWNTSFGFFDEEKNASVIGNVHRALRAGGQFVLDVVNRDFITSQAPSLVWFEGDGCVCMDEMQIDWITSRMRVKRTMMIEDGRSKETEYSIRVYSLHELGKLLHDQGFRIAEVSGRTSTPGVFFGAESPRTLILAEKR